MADNIALPAHCPTRLSILMYPDLPTPNLPLLRPARVWVSHRLLALLASSKPRDGAFTDGGLPDPPLGRQHRRLQPGPALRMLSKQLLRLYLDKLASHRRLTNEIAAISFT